MDIWALKVLDAVVSTGSISGAAVVVRRTQPQVSRIIQTLEEELGFALFLRQGRSVLPTPNCLPVLARARSILDQFDALRVDADRLRLEHSPALHLVGPSYASYGLLPTILNALKSRSPDLQITVSALARSDGGAWQMPDNYDIGLAILPFELPGTHQERFCTMEVALITPRGHPLAAREVVHPEDLADHAFVSLRPAAPLRRRIDRIMEAAGVKLATSITVPDTASALRMVMENMGVTLGDAFSARQIGRDHVSVVRFLPIIRGDLGFFWPADRPRTAHYDAFKVAARAVVEAERCKFTHF